nr:hypothetical protein [uncultured Roseateles sp.]
MNFPDLPPELGPKVAGSAGSLLALLFLKEAWPRNLAMFFGGAAASWFGAEPVAVWLGLTSGFVGFLLGLFSMAIVSKLFETWRTLELGTIISDALRRFFGVSK